MCFLRVPDVANRSPHSPHRCGHSGEKPFTCAECKTDFRHSSSLSDHLRAIHGVEPESKRRRTA